MNGVGSKGEVSVGFRQGWVRYFRVWLPPAGLVGGAIAVADLLGKQPREGFGLLVAWGPWPLITLVGLGFLGHFLNRLSDTVQSTFGSVVESAQESARAHSRTADALQRVAEQGNRQVEETRRLAIYAGRELTAISERMDAQETAQGKVSAAMERIEVAVTALALRTQLEGEGHGRGDG